MGLDSGIIEEGSEADISIFDPERPWKVSSESFHSKSKNSPFDGMLLEGKNIMTFVRGKLVYKSWNIFNFNMLSFWINSVWFSNFENLKKRWP